MIRIETEGKKYWQIIDELDAQLVADTLFDCKGNQTEAALVLGMNRGTFRKKMNLMLDSNQPDHRKNLGEIK